MITGIRVHHAGIGVHDGRNRCSTSVGIRVHVRPESAFRMGRNPQIGTRSSCGKERARRIGRRCCRRQRGRRSLGTSRTCGGCTHAIWRRASVASFCRLRWTAKVPSAPAEWRWQFVFRTTPICRDPRFGRRRAYALGRAVRFLLESRSIRGDDDRGDRIRTVWDTRGFAAHYYPLGGYLVEDQHARETSRLGWSTD
jgi:hypothetical protein